LSQTFERVVDRKDNVIKALAKDTEEADDQYNSALQSHLQGIDELIGKVGVHSSNMYNRRRALKLRSHTMKSLQTH